MGEAQRTAGQEEATAEQGQGGPVGGHRPRVERALPRLQRHRRGGAQRRPRPGADGGGADALATRGGGGGRGPHRGVHHTWHPGRTWLEQSPWRGSGRGCGRRWRRLALGFSWEGRGVHSAIIRGLGGGAGRRDGAAGGAPQRDAGLLPQCRGPALPAQARGDRPGSTDSARRRGGGLRTSSELTQSITEVNTVHVKSVYYSIGE